MYENMFTRLLIIECTFSVLTCRVLEASSDHFFKDWVVLSSLYQHIVCSSILRWVPSGARTQKVASQLLDGNCGEWSISQERKDTVWTRAWGEFTSPFMAVRISLQLLWWYPIRIHAILTYPLLLYLILCILVA